MLTPGRPPVAFDEERTMDTRDESGRQGSTRPRIHVTADHEEMSRAAARFILERLRARPEALLSLATGSSPERAYAILAEEARREPALFGRVRILKLDEWGGLDRDDPATCEAFLREKVLGPLGVPPERYFGFESSPPDPEAECRRAVRWLDAAGPIDLHVLGLGRNGHLGLNEPGPSLLTEPHVAELTDESRAHPMLARARGSVRYGLTLGMAAILGSRRVALLVSGRGKATALRRMLLEEITPQFPASFLRLHPALDVFCDREAAAELPESLKSPGGSADMQEAP
jgi:galactosamine-6-phosphate isomerase